MTDSELRQLERQWKESGSDDDEAAWLVERVRVGDRLDWESYSRLADLNAQAAGDYLVSRVKRGDLDQDRIGLASFCSHEPARLALTLVGGAKAEAPPREPGKWLDDLRVRFGIAGILGLSMELVRTTSDPSVQPLPDHEQAALEGALSAAQAWITCPCDAHAGALQSTSPLGGGVVLPFFAALAVWCKATPNPEVTQEQLTAQARTVLRACTDHSGRSQEDLLCVAREAVVQRCLSHQSRRLPSR